MLLDLQGFTFNEKLEPFEDILSIDCLLCLLLWIRGENAQIRVLDLNWIRNDLWIGSIILIKVKEMTFIWAVLVVSLQNIKCPLDWLKMNNLYLKLLLWVKFKMEFSGQYFEEQVHSIETLLTVRKALFMRMKFIYISCVRDGVCPSFIF